VTDHRRSRYAPKIIGGRKARFAGKDLQCQCTSQARRSGQTKTIEKEHCGEVRCAREKKRIDNLDRRRSTSSEVVVESVKIRHELVSLSGSYGKIERVFEAGVFDFRLSGALLARFSILAVFSRPDPVQTHHGMTN